MAQSLRKVENNIKDLSSYPGFEVNLNLESLLTLNVENQHAVAHFKKETLTLSKVTMLKKSWMLTRGKSNVVRKDEEPIKNDFTISDI